MKKNFRNLQMFLVEIKKLLVLQKRLTQESFITLILFHCSVEAAFLCRFLNFQRFEKIQLSALAF